MFLLGKTLGLPCVFHVIITMCHISTLDKIIVPNGSQVTLSILFLMTANETKLKIEWG